MIRKTRRTSFLLLAGSVIAIASGGQSLSARTLEQPKSQSAAVSAAVATSFGSAVEVVTTLKPFYLIGDFNGDAMQDLLVVVHIKVQRSALPKDVRVLNPFCHDADTIRDNGPGYPTDPMAKPTLGFAIIQGSKTGWKTPARAGKFLLVGVSPVLMLEYARIKTDPNGGMELIKKSSSRYRQFYKEMQPHGAAKGDLVDLPTEGADSFLYWNGTTYRWQEYGGD